jgi:hypothetical protein
MTSKAGEVVLRLRVHQRYFFFRGNADMRKSVDGLSGIIRNGLNKCWEGECGVRDMQVPSHESARVAPCGM